MSGIVRLDVIVLAIMLAGVVVVIIRFSYRFYWAPTSKRNCYHQQKETRRCPEH
jgi:hypothetical protein